MSESSHQAAQPYPAAPEFPRHVVTAVIVSHDGARWLPDALSGLAGQERPVQNVIAADTGSADDSADILVESLGQDRVVHLARRSGFGTAVGEASRTAGPVDTENLPYLRSRTSSGWDPVTRSWHESNDPDDQHGGRPEPVQWLWLLHDDCEPGPAALAELLRVAESSPSIAVVGPKLRSWYDRRSLLEVGVSIAHSGRRWTGLERREQDQGQHDQVRPVLSVSSAGMLVRRDVWEELGGFDRRLPLMRDDVDFCWRVHAAGHRVMIAPDAVLRHAEAAARERRTIHCAADRPHRIDKAGAAYTLLANSRTAVLPYVLLRLVLGTVLRTLGYLVAKVPGQAFDEISGLLGVLLSPHRIIAARRRRSGSQVEAAELRPLFPPPGATLRLAVEQAAGSLGGRRSDAESSAGRHGAVESGPTDEDGDYIDVENFARLKRIARKPAPVLFAGLLVISLIANRDLFGAGSLSGGAMLPAPDGVSDLWARIADGWHEVGTGGTATAPPYLAVVAALATVLFGNVGLAVTVLLVGSVPLAGLTAYFVSRPLVTSRALRAWASVAYALLPAVTGALAAGRIGTAVLAVLLPLLARAAVSAAGLRLDNAAVERGARPTWRSLWGTVLLLTVATAFTPVVWLIAAVLCAVAIGVQAAGGRSGLLVPLALRSAVLLAAPMVLLAPWSLQLLGSPSRFLLEAGLPYSAGEAATATGLVLLNPGGPGVLSGVLLAGILLAGLGALLRAERRLAVFTAWGAALAGLLFALPMNAMEVTPSDGVAPGPAWAGPALLLYGLGLLGAAVLGAEGVRGRVAGMNFGWRQPVAVLVGVAAAAAPVFAAGGWLLRGAGDPLERRDPAQVPAFVAEESSTRDQARTLVLTGSGAEIAYVLVRGAGVTLGDAEIAAADGGDRRLSRVVSNLLAGTGADQAGQLAGYAVRYVLVRPGAPSELSRVLDSTPGIARVSQDNGTALWRVDRTAARLTMRGEDGTQPVAVASGPVEAHTDLPGGEPGRVLRVADRADEGWQATLGGTPLKPVTVDGWAQGFELPAEGGRLDLTYETPFTHTAWLWAQGFASVVVLVLALPGRRREVEDDLPVIAVAAVPPQPVEGEGRRARRLRAQAQAQAEAGAGVAAADGPDQPDGLDGPEAPGGGVPGPEPVYVPEPEPDYYAAVRQQQGQTGQAGQAGGQQDGYDWDAFQAGGGTADPFAVPADYGQYPPQQYPAGQDQPYADPYGYGADGYPQQQQYLDPLGEPDAERRDGSDQQ